MKTVWVLGSGFSRPLGGPLLNQLLSRESEDILAAHYGDVEGMFDVPAKVVRHLYREWLAAQEPGPADAEAFLDYLDGARSSEQSKGRLRRVFDRAKSKGGFSFDLPPFDDLVVSAKRLIAAECCAFLDSANLKTERWDPYRRWVEILGKDDTIVTFNYDRVLELLSTHRELVVRETRNIDDPYEVPTVLKLHGSVDWKIEGNAFAAQAEPDFALRCAPEAIGIATPGPAKIADTGPFAALWKLAIRSLKAADVIVFIGYRFPPTDSRARERLLGAMRENACPGSLRMHIVLGPADPHGDIVRLDHLLRYTAENGGRADIEGRPRGIDRHYQLRRHPLWSQDFLSVVHHKLLTPVL